MTPHTPNRITPEYTPERIAQQGADVLRGCWTITQLPDGRGVAWGPEGDVAGVFANPDEAFHVAREAEAAVAQWERA